MLLGGGACGGQLLLGVGALPGMRLGCGSTGDFYGFAQGLMTSQGDAVRLSDSFRAGGRRFWLTRPRSGSGFCGSTPAAAGFRVHNRAPVRVTAHTLRRRQSSGVVGTLRPPAGALQRGGDPRVGLFGGGPRLVGFLYAVACVALSAGGVACGRQVLGPSPRRRLTEPARFGGVKPHRCCCGPAPSGWTPPNRPGWLRPPTRRGTQNQHPAWSGRTRLTTWPAALARRLSPSAPGPHAGGRSSSTCRSFPVRGFVTSSLRGTHSIASSWITPSAA
ncbi:hypothetical protein ABH935_002541 [Catenulispora sp. GAS73]